MITSRVISVEEIEEKIDEEKLISILSSLDLITDKRDDTLSEEKMQSDKTLLNNNEKEIPTSIVTIDSGYQLVDDEVKLESISAYNVPDLKTRSENEKVTNFQNIKVDENKNGDSLGRHYNRVYQEIVYTKITHPDDSKQIKSFSNVAA